VRFWPRPGSPDPAAAPSAAAGARLGTPQDRLRSDSQEVARQRIGYTIAIFGLLFVAIAGRMGYVSLLRDGGEPVQRVAARGGALQGERADIVDRNSIVLATSVPVMSAFVNPRLVLEPQDAARRLASALPEGKLEEFSEKLEGDRSFAWIKRGLSPAEHDRINRLGIPGLDFQAEERRIYPQGSAAAHILGYSSVDNAGLAGVERYFERELQAGEPLQLSIDLRLQRFVEQEIARAVRKFSAIGATAIVLDATNGEILAMASLPTYDPNRARTITNEALFNRGTLGVYEQGSTFKIFNTAMTLDAGRATLDKIYDAREPIKIDRFTINDFHGQNRAMTVAEVFKFSSNIGSAKMAMDVGVEGQRAFFDRIGMLKPIPIELGESAGPLYPRHWMKINLMTISFGHGISVTPLHLASGTAAMINGGILHRPTLVKRAGKADVGRRVVSERTSVAMRQLLRLAVTEGTGKSADVAGYEVGGKTGTAEKPGRSGYREKALISSFVGAFPMSDPKFVILVSVDEPKGLKETGGYATGGWVAAPSFKAIAEHIVALYGIQPGDWKGGLAPLQVASVAVPPPLPASALTSRARQRTVDQRKALPARAPGAGPAPGERRHATE